jgi:predicted GIY-YIG superfamily endonuclease
MEERLTRHNKGYIDSTKTRIPVQLVSYTGFTNQQKAFAYEKYLKSGSGRAFSNKHLI